MAIKWAAVGVYNSMTLCVANILFTAVGKISLNEY